MKKILVFIYSLVIACTLSAQERDSRDMSAMLEDSLSIQRENKNHLDSIWRKGDIWNLGFSGMDGKNLEAIELPKWAKWNYDLEQYFISKMKYPAQLLAENKAGYSVVMFTIDTLGLPRDINILTTIHKDFDKEVVRLIKELPHCLPCRDENDKRIKCLYTVYVPFLPQHYKDRIKADSIAEENLKYCFVHDEEMGKFQDGKPSAVTNYIYERLTYDPQLLGEAKEVKGSYAIRINSYGEVTESYIVRSCGIEAWDNQVIQIIKTMPRWMPAIFYGGIGKYQSMSWTVPIFFKRN